MKILKKNIAETKAKKNKTETKAKKNKTGKNKTGKNKTRKNKLTKGGHQTGPFVTVVPQESMDQLTKGNWSLNEYEPLNKQNLHIHLNQNREVPTYDIIHRDPWQNPRETTRKCVAQHANFKEENSYYSSHNFCEIDDIIAVALGHLLEIPVYSMDGHITEDSDPKGGYKFFEELSHIPLTFFDSSQIYFGFDNYYGKYYYNNHNSQHHNEGTQKYITIQQIKNAYKNIKLLNKEKPKEVFTKILYKPIYKYVLFKTVDEKKAEKERLAKEKAEKERLAKEKAEKERLAKEKSEKERLVKESTLNPNAVAWNPIPQQQGGAYRWNQQKLTPEEWNEQKGIHMPDISIGELNKIIQKNFKPINSWLDVKKGKYDAILDGLNFMEGGASNQVSIILNENLQKLFKVIFKKHNNPKVLLVYRGHIVHSGTRLMIEKDINKFILNAKNYYPSTIMDIMYVHTSVTDWKHNPKKNWIPMTPTYKNKKRFFDKQGGGLKTKKTKKTKKVRKHQGINQSGGNKGRLKKGYKYSGKKLKSGLPQIIKCKSKKC